ncbi:RNA polymerase sigma factor [Arthrobacter sp. H14]|uniref:RNA polymerase sigma factor n=1 Tax=Arthrobacter sp. H14 TaxID=1312959 RepID=UPI0004BCCE33|nr:RNA polymerase sigma factor [Arthrobacter sp. H14]
MAGADDGSVQPLVGLDEITVISRAQDGDLDAFEQLVDVYQGRIFRLAYRMLNNRPDAEDIVQETMIAAWRQLPVLVTPAAFSGWIYRVCTNECLDLLRRRRSHQETSWGEGEQEPQSARMRSPAPAVAAADPAATAEMSAQMDGLADVLATITPEQRACWLLREMHGHSYQRIAEMLQISEASVRGRIARARGQLAEGMNSWR